MSCVSILFFTDYGYIFESSPGGNANFEPDMKITAEYLDIMDGQGSQHFQTFQASVVMGYLAVRPYCEEILHLVRDR